MASEVLIFSQIVVMVLAIVITTPLTQSATSSVTRLLTGQSATTFTTRLTELRQNWHQKGSLSAAPIFSILCSVSALFILPFFTLRYAFPGIGVPMISGLLLCAALLPSWHAAAQHGPGACPVKLMENRFLSSVRFVVMMLPLIAITGLVVAVGYPFPSDLGDHTSVRPNNFYPPLAGSVFCLAWVYVLTLVHGPILTDEHTMMIQAQAGRDRALLKFGHDLNRVGWYFFVSNLFLPQDILTQAASGIAPFTTFIAMSVLRVLIVGSALAAWRALQPQASLVPRLLLICIAILTVFSGRMVR